MSIRTLAELFMVAAGHQRPDQLQVKEGGRFRPISTRQLVERVRRIAGALAACGVEHGDRVALMADNGPHWPAIDFAALTSGAALVPIYPTLLPEQAAYIVADSGAKVVLVQTREQLDGLLARRGELPDVQRFVLIDGAPPLAESDTGAGGGADGDAVLSIVDFEQLGGELDPEAFGDRAHAVEPDDLASLVYTSGTTGKPKGVVLTHGNFVSNILTCLDLLAFRSGTTALSFLPLSHVFERTVDYCYFYLGCSIAYAESVAAVAQNLQEVRPHLFVSVPRVYEKVLAKIHDNVERGSAVKRQLFNWAVEVGREALPYRLTDRRPPGLAGLKLAAADRLVFSKIRDRLGGRFEFAFSGGAPLGREVAEFFWGAGIKIFEDYGLTETSPVISANMPGAVKLGTVGKPIPGVTVEIAEDGEILVKGPNVMAGYFNNRQATDEAIDPDGWFHTGDIGHLDEDGFLVITDRKKEIIVNAYGKNVAPAPIENKLKGSRFIGQAMVVGDQRKFLSALLVPDFEALDGWAEGQGLATDNRATLVEHPPVQELFEREVAAVNEKLAHYEEVQAFAVLPAEWTLETGELTPTQKVKRRVVLQKYADAIDRIYSQAAAPRPERGGDQ